MLREGGGRALSPWLVVFHRGTELRHLVRLLDAGDLGHLENDRP